MSQVNIAIVGLGFGAEFIPIYQHHPDANMYAICQRTQAKLDEIGDKYGIAKRYTSYDDLLADPDVHAVHINSPIPDHGRQAIQALKAGKHVACTVPMATTVEECRQIVELVKETGLKYMMMETVVYAREFLFMKEMYDKGELGKVQFLKASHQQDMEGWPGYWPGLPPMFYATHCVGPILGLTRGEAEYVSCFGSGTIAEEMHACYGSTFAIESCHIKFKDSDLSAQLHRSLFDVARQYRESFEVYGTKKSVEWPLIEHDPLVIHTAKLPEPEIPQEVKCPDFAHYLPEESRPSLPAASMAAMAKRTIFPSPRAAATAAPTRTSRTSSSKCSSPATTPIRTLSRARTSPAPASSPTSPRSRVARSSACRHGRTARDLNSNDPKSRIPSRGAAFLWDG
ncbi:MAG: hypothetical protein RLZZ214_3764 [Verrucomicrobiota bacterium]